MSAWTPFRGPLVASVLAGCALGCGAKSAPASPPIWLPPAIPERTNEGASVAPREPEVVASPDLDGGALTRTPLRRTTFASACAALRARSELPELRGDRGGTLTLVGATCRPREAGPLALLEVTVTTAFPRHADVDTVAVAPALRAADGGWLVALGAAEESGGMQNMARGDRSGRVAIAQVDRVDLVGTDAPEVILVLSVLEHPDVRADLVVCDPEGAWCTAPVLLDRGARGDAGPYAFERHPRGILVRIAGAPPGRARVFGLAAAP